MKRLLISVGAGVALMSAAAASNALPLVTYSTPGSMDTPVAGATKITFEDGSCDYASCTGDFTIEPIPSGTGQSAAPAGDTSKYFLSVPNPNSSGSATFGLGTTANYFGLYWGSIDRYNTIEFLNNGTSVASYTGSDLATPSANGDQVSTGTNRYINFYFGSQLFNQVKMTSTNFAFESDNHAYAMVPEPGTLALLGLGLVGLGLARRKTRS